MSSISKNFILQFLQGSEFPRTWTTDDLDSKPKLGKTAEILQTLENLSRLKVSQLLQFKIPLHFKDKNVISNNGGKTLEKHFWQYLYKILQNFENLVY